MRLLLLSTLFLFSPLYSQNSKNNNRELYQKLAPYLIPETNKNIKDWLFKVDDFNFSYQNFKISFNYMLSNLPDNQLSLLDTNKMIDLEKQYIEQYITENILVISAFDEKILESREAEEFLQIALVKAISQYYLQYHFPKDKNTLMPSKEEINQYYQSNRERFVELGMNAEQIQQVATQELAQAKVKKWMEEKITLLKESYRIKRNQDLLKNKGLN